MSNLPSSMLDQVEGMMRDLETLKSFALVHGLGAPTSIVNCSGRSLNRGPMVTFFKSDKEAVAKWFGADGWFKKATGISVDWEKIVDGVTVVISDAERCEPMGTQAVEPAEFLK